MNSSQLLRAAALAAGAVALLIALFASGSIPLETEEEQGWPDIYVPSAAEQAADLALLERLIEPEADSVPPPVPPFSGAFEVPEGLKPRVKFWVRVYTDINTYQAIIHDSYDLTRIYGLVDLRDEPGVDPAEFDSIRRGALRVLRRYQDHLRFLTLSRYDADKLVGERRRLYNLMRAAGGVKRFKGAERRMRVQRGLRDMLRDSIVRSGRYLPRYLEIFRRKGLPQELVLLPHLESSFSYRARSYAGAVGIWQLTKVAARPHMHINSVVDERIDPWRSAEVAALLLADNYRQLRSWPLAITAYNQGVGAMKRAIRNTGSRDIEVIIESYRSRNFGFAGRNFYAGFLAIVEVLQHYELHFGPLPIEPAFTPRQHRLSKAASLASICRELGIRLDTLGLLNPALRLPAYNSSARLPRGLMINLPPKEESAP